MFSYLLFLISCHGSPVRQPASALLTEFLGFSLKNFLQTFKTSLKNSLAFVFFLC